jgi:plasmid stabilization system protein ParE
VARGDKSTYTDKQKRKAAHIAEGYRKRGKDTAEAERRAWATVNKESGGGNKSGSGRGKPDTPVSSKRGGKLGSRKVSAAKRSAAGKKAAQTRKRNAARPSH